MRILRVYEVRNKWCFQAKYLAGVEIAPTDLITRCKLCKINAELKHPRPDVSWRKQVMGREAKEKFSENF